MDSPKTLTLRDLRKRFTGPARVLEVGFGDGRFVKNLSDSGYSVIATEISAEMVAETQSKVSEATVLLSDDPSELQGDFDAVCCFEVLEHLPDPEAFAKKLPGNSLFASVPNPWRWYPKLTGRYEYWDYPPNHLWRYCDCAPIGPDHHDANCKLVQEHHVASGQKTMSLRWILHQAGYTKINIRKTPVQAHDILRIIPIRKVSNNYDQMRRRSMFGMLTSTVRTLSVPATLPMAGVLNLLGFAGVSFYVTATRDQ